MNNREIDSFDENVKPIFQRLMPLLVSLLFVLFSYVPMYGLVFDNIKPAMGIICIYYWMIHRPDLFGLLSSYFLGLIDDVISSVPLGTNTFTLLAVYLLLYNINRLLVGKPFNITWYVFMAVAFFGFFVKWLSLSIFYSQFLPFSMVLFSYLVTIAIYPLLSLIFAFVQNKIIQEEA